MVKPDLNPKKGKSRIHGAVKFIGALIVIICRRKKFKFFFVWKILCVGLDPDQS